MYDNFNENQLKIILQRKNLSNEGNKLEMLRRLYGNNDYNFIEKKTIIEDTKININLKNEDKNEKYIQNNKENSENEKKSINLKSIKDLKKNILNNEEMIIEKKNRRKTLRVEEVDSNFGSFESNFQILSKKVEIDKINLENNIKNKNIIEKKNKEKRRSLNFFFSISEAEEIPRNKNKEKTYRKSTEKDKSNEKNNEKDEEEEDIEFVEKEFFIEKIDKKYDFYEYFNNVIIAFTSGYNLNLDLEEAMEKQVYLKILNYILMVLEN
jgi:hypothetical protein